MIVRLMLVPNVALAQREYTVVKPKERAKGEKVVASKTASQASRGVLVVVLDPIVTGKITVFDTRGRILEEAQASADGRAEFELRRNQPYRIRATFPGYLSAEGQSTLPRGQDTVRLELKAQFARLELPGLPSGAEILIDDKPRAVADQKGLVVLDNIDPGPHTLLVRHPEYNDYRVPLGVLDAGSEVTFFSLNTILVKVAKLMVEGPPGATVMIDGAFQGRIEENGKVRIDYALERAAEHTIRVELPEHVAWTKRELLAPGPRNITVSLERIATSTGVTDFFDDLLQWNAPPTWKILSDPRNRRLEVRGDRPGMLKEKIYKNFQANFTIWMPEGKGATWIVRVSPDERNYYMFHLAGPGSTMNVPRRFYSYLVKDGAAPVAVSTPIPLIVDLDAQSSYTITLSVTAHTVKHTITSNTTGEPLDLGIWTDTSQTRDRFLFGSFGFRSLAGETFIVDDFSLVPIKEQ